MEVAQDLGERDDERPRRQGCEQRAHTGDTEDDPAVGITCLTGDLVAPSGTETHEVRPWNVVSDGGAGASTTSSSATWARIRPKRAWASSIIDARRVAFASRMAIWRRTRPLGIGEIEAAFGRVGRLAEPLAVALAGRLVLEQLADLGEREAGVVAKAADELESIEVGGVVEAVVAIGPGRRLEQADLFVIPDPARGHAGLGRHLVDPKQARPGRLGRGHLPDDSTTLTFT